MRVIDHILENEDQLPPEKKIVKVMFAWFECEKGRIAKLAEDGTELGIAVAGGVKRGNVLLETEEKAYVVDIIPCRLIEIRVKRLEEAVRMGFELGNRHLPVKIEEGRILVPYDRPTFEYLQKFGSEVNEISDVFDGYTVCKAHGKEHHG